MAETSKKAPTWSPEQTVALVAAWDTVGRSNDRIPALAAKMGRSERSCIMKLVREGLYRKAVPVTKNGEKVESREEIADEIASFLPDSFSEDVGSLAKSNKRILRAIRQALSDAVAFKKAAQESFEQSAENMPEAEAETE